MQNQNRSNRSKFAFMVILFIMGNTGQAQSDFFAAKQGTYSTSSLSKLSDYVGVFEASKYNLNDDSYRAQPMITISKDKRQDASGYILEIRFPCSTKEVPTLYSFDSLSSNIELIEEGSGQCSILEGFKLTMHSSIDFVDGGILNQTLRLYVGYRSPLNTRGYIEFTPANNKSLKLEIGTNTNSSQH